MYFIKTLCIVIDGYSTGKNLVTAFKSKGYPCIHIKSSRSLPEKFKHNEAEYILNLHYQNNIEELVESLAPYCIKLCIPGYESGVELADLLSEKLNLPSNGSQYSQGRRDKYIMTEMIAASGIKTVKHFKSENLENILRWTDALNSFPIVLKPLDSANGDGVFFCNNKAEIKNAFNCIMTAENQFGKQNQCVLAQTYNAGKEYIVNTVSWEGNHYVAEMWRVTKEFNTTIYNKAEIVHPMGQEWQPIVDYTMKVLDALHILYGAGTTEVKYTAENGPLLLETSSRLMAGAPLAFSQEIIGYSQLSLLVEAYLNTQDFLQRFKHEQPVPKYQGMDVTLISDCEGVLQSSVDVNQIQQLATLHSYIIDGEAGCSLVKTVNSLTSPGEIFLLSTTKEALEKDYNQIRLLEESGLYRNALCPRKAPIFKEGSTTQTLFQPVQKSIDNDKFLTSVIVEPN